MQPLWFHRYTLQLRGPHTANAASQLREIHGCLLRSDDGFACLQPWPELGDLPLEHQLQLLKASRSSRLIARSLQCMAADAAARHANRSLFAGLSIPPSHATLLAPTDFPALASLGFTHVKLKARPADPSLPTTIRDAAAAGLRVRLDFNGRGTSNDWTAIAPLAHAIDFIEDPIPWNPAAWRDLHRQTGINLALDWLPSGSEPTPAFSIRILKPAADDPANWLARPEPVVFTSYMDHPIGQMWAACEAARWPHPQLPAGLITHPLFEPDEFTEAVRAHGPQLLPPDGPGLGFGPLLAKLPWLPLVHPPSVFIPAKQEAPNPIPWDPDGPGILLTNPRLPPANPPPPDALPRGHLVFPTSGSTGSTPSLVCLSIPAFLANAAAVNAWLHTDAHDKWLRALPDFHVGGLAIHARAHLANIPVITDHDRWNPARFASLVASHHITLASLVPTQLHDLVTAGIHAPTSLRCLLIGGGALPPPLAAAAQSLGWPILATYGMTEASSQIATANPHGNPLQLHLLPCWDARTEPDGRLAIRGAPLLTGFLSLHDNTWQLTSPLSPDGFFTTNDRATVTNRSLQFLGRSDRTVKILGELVDIDAVERALTNAGMPPEAGCVIPTTHPRNGTALALLTEANATTAALWTTIAAASLPPFARISAIHPDLTLPRSPLGKLLRATAATLIPPAKPH